MIHREQEENFTRLRNLFICWYARFRAVNLCMFFVRCWKKTSSSRWTQLNDLWTDYQSRLKRLVRLLLFEHESSDRRSSVITTGQGLNNNDPLERRQSLQPLDLFVSQPTKYDQRKTSIIHQHDIFNDEKKTENIRERLLGKTTTSRTKSSWSL